MGTPLSVSNSNRLRTDRDDKSTWPQPCRHCGTVKQTREFGKNKSGGWYTMCPNCRRTRYVRELYMEQGKQISRAVKELVAVALKKSKPLPDMADICSDVVAACGGQDEFVKRWAESIMATTPGSKTSIDAHKGLASTIQATAAQQSRDMELEQISPEKLADAITAFMEGRLGDGEAVEMETEPEALEYEDPVNGD